MIHPLNALDNQEYIRIITDEGPRRISLRRYKVSSSYRGVFGHLVGEVFRLISLKEDSIPGEYLSDMVSVARDEDVMSGRKYIMGRCIAFKFSELDPMI